MNEPKQIWITAEDKMKSLAIFQDKDFTKEQLEQMISLVLIEGLVPLPEIQAIADGWQKIIKLQELHPYEKTPSMDVGVKAPYMDLDD